MVEERGRYGEEGKSKGGMMKHYLPTNRAKTHFFASPDFVNHFPTKEMSRFR